VNHGWLLSVIDGLDGGMVIVAKAGVCWRTTLEGFAPMKRFGPRRRYGLKPATRNAIYSRILPTILVSGMGVNAMIKEWPLAKARLFDMGIGAALPVAVVMAAIMIGRLFSRRGTSDIR
jgi:hypothetical protein